MNPDNPTGRNPSLVIIDDLTDFTSEDLAKLEEKLATFMVTAKTKSGGDVKFLTGESYVDLYRKFSGIKDSGFLRLEKLAMTAYSVASPTPPDDYDFISGAKKKAQWKSDQGKFGFKPKQMKRK